MNDLKGKTAIVTGGGRGIGFGVAEALAENGVNLVLTDIRRETLDEAKEKLERAYKVSVLPIIADGGDEGAVKRVVEEAVRVFGRLDLIVNNAQASKSGVPLEQHSTEDFKLAIDTGLYATFYYMKHGFAHLKQSRGKVINFGSGAAMSGGMGQASYAAAKEGIRGMSRVAAREWGKYGITVNVVCPLSMTPGLAEWKKEFPEKYAENIKNIPLQRFGDPKEDIGGVCVFIASKAADYITGETFSVQGGSGLRP